MTFASSPVPSVFAVPLQPETGVSDDSIYRYDRAALIGALSRAPAKGAANG